MARGLSIGQLASSTGVHLETVRYYERVGLMPAPHRTEGGHRSYEPEHRRRLRFIRRARELGFGLDDIRRLIALSQPGVLACAEVRELAQGHVEAVDARIADLQRVRRVLIEAVSCCDADAPVSCPVIAALGGD